MDSSKFFIIGANGQLGKALKAKYPDSRSADIDELDITDSDSVNNFDWTNVGVILNAAAYTNVDGAESQDGRIAAWKVNSGAVALLSQIAIKNDITFVHISTEYVFDGRQVTHKENEPVSPLGVYAQSKASAEHIVSVIPRHYCLRTSWLIGDGNNFVRTMMGLAEKNVSPTVVSDQIGRLTFTRTLVSAIHHLLSTNCQYGIYNVSNDGDPASWADVTREIFKDLGRDDLMVKDTTTAQYYAHKPESALRPLHSAFDLTKIKSTGLVLPDWRENLKTYVAEELANGK